MNSFEDSSMVPGHPVKIVRHHNKWLNEKTGIYLGKDSEGYYNQRVWLLDEQITVIVNQTNLLPVDNT